LLLILLFGFSSPGSFTHSVSEVSAVTGVATLCSSLPGGDQAGGIYPTKGGAFVEDQKVANLIFCGGGTSKIIATAPFTALADDSMTGIVTTAHGLVLALASDDNGGFWLCYHATASGCGSKSPFIFVDASNSGNFCKSEHAGFCNVHSIALDNSLNVYYVDLANGVLVECLRGTGSYSSCNNLPASSAFAGHSPNALFLRGTEFYVGDGACAGALWVGTKSSLTLVASLGDRIDSITVSTDNPQKSPHIYLGIAGSCNSVPAHVLDYNDMITLPTPFTAPGDLYGLDKALQITTSFPGAAYRLTDSS